MSWTEKAKNNLNWHKKGCLLHTVKDETILTVDNEFVDVEDTNCGDWTEKNKTTANLEEKQ